MRGVFYVSVNRKNDFPWLADIGTYLAKTKTWKVVPTAENLGILQEHGLIKQADEVIDNPIPKALMKKLPSNLYDVQKEGLQFAYNRAGTCLIAYDMGLGKTAISLSYTLLEDIPCTIVICQASLKTQWESQIKLWLGDTPCTILYGRTPVDIQPTAFIIVNYEILAYHTKVLASIKPDLVIVDEAQYFQNHSSARTKALYKLAANSKRIMALSGTPITKSPVQFYPILHILLPTKFPDLYGYRKRYCDAKITDRGWDYSGASNVEEFRSILSSVMIRRRKADSLDLPEKRIIPLVLDFDEKLYKEYVIEEADIVGSIFEHDYVENKNSFIYLQYLAYAGKRKEMLNWIAETSKTEKVIVFCVHRKIVDDIYSYFENDAVKYYGGMSQKEKDEAKQKFCTDKQIFIGNIASAGTGLDGLQKVCNTVAFVQLPFTSTAFDQATDRVWRIGQAKEVNVFVLVAKNSVEMRIVSILDKHRTMVERIIDGKEYQEIDLLKELMKSYTKQLTV